METGFTSQMGVSCLYCGGRKIMQAKIPLHCDKIVFTLESNNDMALTNAYEQVLHLLNEKFAPVVKYQVSLEEKEN